MTYPPQPGAQFPGYPPAPPPQPGAYPAYAQPPAMGVPGVPAPAPAPVSQQQPVSDVPLNIVEPTGGGEWAPAPRHLIGRAVLGVPRMFDPGNQFQGQARPQVIVDFVVASIGPDGSPVGPIEFGDSQARDGTAHPCWFRVDEPIAEFTGGRWNNQVIVEYIAPLVGTGQLFMGRIVQGTQGNKPPLINALAQDDPARQMLIEAWRQRTAVPGSLKRTPVEINGGPPKKQDAQQAYGPQQAYGGMPPTPGVPQGAQVQYPGYPPAPVAQHGPYAGQPLPQTGAVMAQQQVPPAALAQGWTPETWAAAPPPVRAAYGAQ